MLLVKPRSASDTVAATTVLGFGALVGHCVWFLYYNARSQLHCLSIRVIQKALLRGDRACFDREEIGFGWYAGAD